MKSQTFDVSVSSDLQKRKEDHHEQHLKDLMKELESLEETSWLYQPLESLIGEGALS